MSLKQVVIGNPASAKPVKRLVDAAISGQETRNLCDYITWAFYMPAYEFNGVADVSTNLKGIALFPSQFPVFKKPLLIGIEGLGRDYHSIGGISTITLLRVTRLRFDRVRDYLREEG